MLATQAACYNSFIYSSPPSQCPSHEPHSPPGFIHIKGSCPPSRLLSCKIVTPRLLPGGVKAKSHPCDRRLGPSEGRRSQPLRNLDPHQENEGQLAKIRPPSQRGCRARSREPAWGCICGVACRKDHPSPGGATDCVPTSVSGAFLVGLACGQWFGSWNEVL